MTSPATFHGPTSTVHNTTLSDEMRYAAIAVRDRSQDGAWYYAVRTTGVFCKPSCGARLAKRGNVSFHATIEDAVAAGFRACKRCRPDAKDTDVHAAVVTAACRMIDQALQADGSVPSLDALARHTGYSPFHLHRIFRAATGLTPRAYGAASRARILRERLDDSDTVSQAMHSAGYSSSSRFYETSTERLGMTPSRAKRGGIGETVRYAISATSLGAILVGATAKGVCSIQLGDDPKSLVRALESRFAGATLVGDDPAFADTVAKVVGFVESPRGALDLPLDIRGTTFQERVWAALTKIAPGVTATYAEVAKAIGSPNSVRAVAAACAANELAIVIPCHRVIKSDGAIAGYRWGVERKSALLKREAAE
jgi:AraC family transcriptional regulator, regulatory protein of adaptative response / methylated-DNA-[protein]-cysteine methyltransferase